MISIILQQIKEPVPIKPWRGVLRATDYGKSCHVFNKKPPLSSNSEDCLFLNVYTPGSE